MKYGNLCIAAHNYKDGTFFSNISELEIGDIITIYDIYKSNEKDLSCISQDTNNMKIITLITCDNIDNSKRVIIKAKENI